MHFLRNIRETKKFNDESMVLSGVLASEKGFLSYSMNISASF